MPKKNTFDHRTWHTKRIGTAEAPSFFVSGWQAPAASLSTQLFTPTYDAQLPPTLNAPGAQFMQNKPNTPPEPKPPVGVVRPQRHIIRNLLILLVVSIVAVGFWRNWFVISTHESPESEKVDINLKVDKAKIKADTEKVAEETKKEAETISAKVKEEAQKLREPSK
jgi:hypothetical protein